MATHTIILAQRIPMDRGALQGCKESDTTEQLRTGSVGQQCIWKRLKRKFYFKTQLLWGSFVYETITGYFKCLQSGGTTLKCVTAGQIAAYFHKLSFSNLYDIGRWLPASDENTALPAPCFKPFEILSRGNQTCLPGPVTHL